MNLSVKTLNLRETGLCSDMRNPRMTIKVYLSAEEGCIHLVYLVTPLDWKRGQYHVFCMGEVNFWGGKPLRTRVGMIAVECPFPHCRELIVKHIESVRENLNFPPESFSVEVPSKFRTHSWKRARSLLLNHRKRF